MAKRKPTPERTTPITRDDIERGLLNVQSGFRKSVEDRKSTIATVAGGAGLLLVIIVFLLGRRSGKKKTTFVEIRRV
jgi:hypothetical protein